MFSHITLFKNFSLKFLQTPILDDINVSVQAHEVVAIVRDSFAYIIIPLREQEIFKD